MLVVDPSPTNDTMISQAAKITLTTVVSVLLVSSLTQATGAEEGRRFPQLKASEMPPGSALTAHLRGSTPTSKDGKDLPQQVHLALAGENAHGVSDGMAVSWLTQNKTSTSVVKYGTESSEYPNIAHGTCSSYLFTWDHHVVITGLKPNTKYYYVVGDEEAGFSQEYFFKTAPDGIGQLPLTLMVYGKSRCRRYVHKRTYK